MAHIRIFHEKRNYSILVAVEDDNCLSLSSLQRAFPGCTGLYHHSDNGNDIILVPGNNNGCFQCEWNYEIAYHPYYPGNIEGTQQTSEFYVYCILLDARPNSLTSSSSSFFRQLCVTAAGNNICEEIKSKAILSVQAVIVGHDIRSFVTDE
ncbi:unnamed protein product [Adineta steineri]|uniref:TAR DNA-binding protein 43 N-terminal domain-containing protein n=1 Tax=Adineta steineri TaxID=433720 RepID=A0A815RJC2_9BILA|nr:unnamed protein product [Adineta steineri]CAF1637867.1 unnamed protein product [Adineta steineri]